MYLPLASPMHQTPGTGLPDVSSTSMRSLTGTYPLRQHGNAAGLKDHNELLVGQVEHDMP